MLFSLACTALLAASGSARLLSSRQAIPATCATGVHVIATGGDGAHNVGRYGLIETLVNNITAVIPGSYGVTIDYDKGSDDKVKSLNGGQVNLRRYITEYVRKCPNTKLAVLGYSAGAIITMNTLCGGTSPWAANTPISSTYSKQIIGTIIYGDLTRTQKAPYNQGTCEGAYDTGPGRYPRKQPACLPFATYMKSYCDFADPQCCVGGFDPAKHFTYPQNYDYIARDYIVGRWQATRTSGTRPDTASSSSSVVAASSSSSSSSVVPAASSSSSVPVASSSSSAAIVENAAPTGAAAASSCSSCTTATIDVTTTTVVTVTPVP